MKKVIFLASLAAGIAFGGPVTVTTICTPFSGPVVVVQDGGCFGSGFNLTASPDMFVAEFHLSPNYFPPTYTGPCTGGAGDICGQTEMVVSFADEIYFDQTGLATFYVDRSNLEGGSSPYGQFPTGQIAGHAWQYSIFPFQVPVGPGHPVPLTFSADWFGPCCHDGAAAETIDLYILKIVFTDLAGNSLPSTYNSASGLAYPVINGIQVPEPSSAFAAVLGLGLIGVLRERRLRLQRSARRRS